MWVRDPPPLPPHAGRNLICLYAEIPDSFDKFSRCAAAR
ncbi:hypothetical protein AcetOrient_orf03288 [Acetobacter orientalis]|uniref:Uncharacterized protein n=1 Tax=Acetobacter orientalis TaxID=146474 RepID=A0A2Z5ZJN1_9PROT|nr:hypothetical protein AcetOrient_orf03288 [Acetobacter orientalis]